MPCLSVNYFASSLQRPRVINSPRWIVGERAEKLAHGLYANGPSLPVLALDGDARSVFLNDEVHAAIRVHAATSADDVSRLPSTCSAPVVAGTTDLAVMLNENVSAVPP